MKDISDVDKLGIYEDETTMMVETMRTKLMCRLNVLIKRLLQIDLGLSLMLKLR
jgi:hypothetical protein